MFLSKLVSELDGMKQAVVRKLHYVLTAWLQNPEPFISCGRQLRWNEVMKSLVLSLNLVPRTGVFFWGGGFFLNICDLFFLKIASR